MTRITLVITLLFFTHLLYGQTFNKRFGEGSDLGNTINCRSSCVLEDTIYLYLGEHTTDWWKIGIYKVSIEGELLNYQLHGGYPEWTYPGWVDGIQVASDTSLVTFGWYTSAVLDTIPHGRIQLFDTNGEILWEKIYGDDELGHAFQQGKLTSDGGFIAIGNGDYSLDNSKFYVVKTDNQGNEEWHTYLGFGSNFRSAAWVNEIPDGSGYVVSGFEDDTPYDPVGLVFVIDTLGNVLDWEKYSDWGPYDEQSASAILPCMEGGFIFASEINLSQWSNSGYWEIPQLVRIDESLDTVWVCDLTQDSYLQASAQVVLENSDGSFATVGSLRIDDADGLKSQGHISKVSSEGELIWHRTYHYAPYGDNLLFDIDKMPNGGYLCTGWMNGMPAFGDSIPDQDAWLLAVDSMGCLVPGCDTLTDATTELIPIQFSIYPNPTSQFINIAIGTFPILEELTIEVYDLHGKPIKQYAVRQQNPTVIIDCEDMANGTYLVSVRSENFISTQRVVVVH